MKELTIEEKAKAYDEAKINGSRLCECGEITRTNYEFIFPELKESENERIRKWIIRDIKQSLEDNVYNDESIDSAKEALAWLKKQGEHANFLSKIQIGDKVTRNEDGVLVNLSQLNRVAKKDEKQGEHKPTDKVELKFKVGDWVMLDRPVLITKVEDMPYNTHQYWTSDGTWFGDATNAKLWDISDAKDGDVLCCESGWTCIFKTLNSDNISFSPYCFMDNTGWFCETGSECHTLDKVFIKAYNGEIHPATKEQRDTLERAITNAGYRWDKEKLKLEKL